MKSNYHIGALIIRVLLGITFFAHGFDKYQGGIGNIAGWFDSIGIPGFMAYIVATIELIGGLALILGFGTRIVSALMVLILLVATFKVKLAVGFFGNGQMAGYELDLSMIGAAIYLLLNGSYVVSIDSLFKKGQKPTQLL
ncbi:DoxX family protein [Paenibacillus sp. Soil787]|uniref:DoxX family protein n=1 Tax=Paenibacillus sp. Soil787 TaxID=1736411 RepID=UPI000702983E|nr:DoxX family protein [Paenibacillus sp. Soil787]KRF13438.1 oxidoreductase [Paenibacillus sp. Soil787]